MGNQSLKSVATEFLALVASGKITEAYERFVGAGFQHHNPNVRGDAESLRQAMQANASRNPGKTLEVRLALQEDDRVVVFSRVRQHAGDLGGAVVHIFRFADGRIAEFWDIGQAVPNDSINENGMF